MNKFVLAVVMLCADLQQKEVDAVSVEELKTTFAALHQTFVERFQAKDLEGTSAIFTPDAILMPNGYQTYNGLAGVKEYFETRFSGGPPSDSTIVFENTDLIPISDDYAFEEGIISVTSKDNEPIFQLRYAILWFKNSEGVWKRHRFVSNAVV